MKNKIKPQHINDFLHDLANLIKTGIPLLDCLTLLEHSIPPLKLLIMSISHQLQKGQQLSQALAKHPKYFDTITCALLQAGEQSGQLLLMLEKIIYYNKRSAKINKQVKKALFYPCTVLTLATIITVFMLLFVIPRFAQMFHDFGAQLPWFTRWVLNASGFIQHWGLVLVIGITTLALGLRHYQRKTQKLSALLWRLLFGAPVLKHFIPASVYARINATMAIMVDAGLPITQAISTASAVAAHPQLVTALNNIKSQLASGESLFKSIEQAQCFPLKMSQLIAVGEQSGTLDAMLNHCAELFEHELAKAIDRLGDLIEPLMMAILGIIIGGLVIAMYLPLFKLGNVL